MQRCGGDSVGGGGLDVEAAETGGGRAVHRLRCPRREGVRGGDRSPPRSFSLARSGSRSVKKRGMRLLSRSLGVYWVDMHAMCGGSGRAAPQPMKAAHIFGPSPGSEAAGCCTHMHGEQKWFLVVSAWFDGGTGNRRSGPHNPPGRECPASEAPRDFTSEVDGLTWIPPSACRYKYK